jgi:mono/diheme cytochrome c family protein
MLKVVVLAVLLALGSVGVAASGYGRIEKPELGGNGPLAIQMPPGLQAPPYHYQPSLEWWAARHGERVSSIGLNECLGCHNPETSCNNCHAYVGVKPILVGVPTVIVAMMKSPVRVTTIPTTSPPTVAPTATLLPASSAAAVVSPATGIAATAVLSPAPAPAAVAASVPSYARDIAPIIQANCVTCHGAGGHGGWSASSYELMMNTGRNKPVIVPGNPNESLMIQKVTGKEKIGSSMPPFGPLTPEEIDLLIRWVAAGAPNN